MARPLSKKELERELAQRAEETIQVLTECSGDRTKAAQQLGISRSALRGRLRGYAAKGYPIPASRINGGAYGVSDHPGRIDVAVEDGVVLIGSDAHIWPGDPTTAMRAFQTACDFFSRRHELQAVCLNGDVVDAAAINRHQSIGWEQKPTFAEEVAAAQTRLREIRQAAGDVGFVWTFGNHDQNFESRIANLIPGLEGMPGVHLKDHFPDWEPCWSLWLNGNVVVKHRVKGGIHATHNNTLWAGVSIVTGHLHSLKVTPFTDYRGTRWGVDTGTLAKPYGPQFIHYTEGSPVNWRAGFSVLTFHKGQLLWPEVVHIIGESEWEFRGKVYRG